MKACTLLLVLGLGSGLGFGSGFGFGFGFGLGRFPISNIRPVHMLIPDHT